MAEQYAADAGTTTTTTYVRKDIWSLPADDPIVVGYANAVAAMQQRPESDPTSWAYQAAMHGSYTTPPLNLWNTCEHGSWFFLPWHRMYLYYFERIVRAAVVAAGGPDDWALPYWNYTQAAGGNPQMPAQFRDPNSPLYVSERRTSPYNVNNGDPLPGPATSTTQALGTIPFEPTGQPITGFGGQTTGPIHFNGGFGAIEQQPHNVIHVAVGGNGWMSDPNTAAQDPIFWLHHANIDRLWAEWIAMGDGRADSTNQGWLGQSFSFYDENGDEVSFTVAEVLDLQTLGYTYDPAPAGAGGGGLESLEAAEPTQATADREAQMRPTELVGASSQPVRLTGDRAKGSVTVDSRARLESLGDAAAPRRVILQLDDIEGERNPGIVYGVYVNLPDGIADDAAERYLAGPLSFFGIEGSGSRADGADHVHSYSAGYDITKLVENLSASGEWDESNIDVTFHPLGVPLDESPQLEANSPPVTVGRIAVHYG